MRICDGCFASNTELVRAYFGFDDQETFGDSKDFDFCYDCARSLQKEFENHLKTKHPLSPKIEPPITHEQMRQVQAFVEAQTCK
jgi:hypothetical protein